MSATCSVSSSSFTPHWYVILLLNCFLTSCVVLQSVICICACCDCILVELSFSGERMAVRHPGSCDKE